MPREQPTFRMFLAGEDIPEDFGAEWHEMIRKNVAAGKTMQRVKFVRRPFTDYTRYLMSWGVVTNSAAGEDLDKYLHWRDVALPEAVPFGEYRT